MHVNGSYKPTNIAFGGPNLVGFKEFIEMMEP